MARPPTRSASKANSAWDIVWGRGARRRKAWLSGGAAPRSGTDGRMSPTINSGDTAWMLTSTALVLMMTIPGLALFYGGMVRKKNVLATVMQSFAVTCLV